MGQHTVPINYLKGFAVLPEKSMIWVYEKGKPDARIQAIGNTAQENKIWLEKTEKFLNLEVEEPANKVLSKIRNHQPITQIDKLDLAKYMSMLLVRVPAGRKRIVARAPEVSEHLKARIHAYFESEIKKYPDRKMILQTRLTKIDQIIENQTIVSQKEVLDGVLKPDNFQKTINIFTTMSWVFLTSNNKNAFITSDNPVFFDMDQGLIDPNNQVIFPISSTIALLAQWSTKYAEGFTKTRETVIREINRRTACGANRYIFYSKDDQGIVNLGNCKKWKLNQLI